mgnify:FL=1
MLPRQETTVSSTINMSTEKKLVPDRYQLKKKLGQGTFSKCSPNFDK